MLQRPMVCAGKPIIRACYENKERREREGVVRVLQMVAQSAFAEVICHSEAELYVTPIPVRQKHDTARVLIQPTCQYI